MADIRVRVCVRGHVQGVWYRGSAQQEASRLGVGGWVRNMRDGAVELEAQGPRERVDELVAWCRQGPPSARVESVEVEPIEPASEARGFTIRQ
jgi:acylphosphatase